MKRFGKKVSLFTVAIFVCFIGSTLYTGAHHKESRWSSDSRSWGHSKKYSQKDSRNSWGWNRQARQDNANEHTRDWRSKHRKYSHTNRNTRPDGGTTPTAPAAPTTPTPQPQPTPAPSNPAPIAPPLAGSTLPPPITGTNYQLVFSDEFNGTSVDHTKWDTNMTWSTQTPVCASSGDTGCYNDRNVTVGNGIARIKAERSGNNYTIGILNTDHKFRFTYGYVEVRAKLPRGQGLWPAIWLYNPQYIADEMDIMEFLDGRPTELHHNYHYEGGNKGYVSKSVEWTREYHVFAMKWEPNLLVWYVDNVEVGRVTGPVVSTVPAYLMINLDLGGSWGGPVNSSTPFPAYFDIDYARIYQRK